MKKKFMKFYQVTVSDNRIDEKCQELAILGHEIIAILPHFTPTMMAGHLQYDYIIVSKGII